jgi:hypothetical protein
LELKVDIAVEDTGLLLNSNVGVSTEVDWDDVVWAPALERIPCADEAGLARLDGLYALEDAYAFDIVNEGKLS